MNIIIESMTQSHLDKIRDNLQENFDEFWNENVLKSELENPASTYIVAIDEENDNESSENKKKNKTDEGNNPLSSL